MDNNNNRYKKKYITPPKNNLQNTKNCSIMDQPGCIEMNTKQDELRIDQEEVLMVNDEDDDMSNINSTYTFTNNAKIECNLLKILFDMGAPNYAYKEIMNWAKDAY